MLNSLQLGEKLKDIRKELSFSQDFVAKELEITRQAVIAIEAGKRKIDSFELFKLADLYNVSASDLLTEQASDVFVSNFQEAVTHLRKNNLLNDEEKKALFEFKKICDDYESLKNL